MERRALFAFFGLAAIGGARSAKAQSSGARRTGRFEVYRDCSGGWRWRYISSNGRIIAESSEPYVNRKECEDGLRLVRNAADAPVNNIGDFCKDDVLENAGEGD
ncbi:MAG: DUF1508 domain-containing protein [Pseudomonadota bacterium]